MATRVVEDGRVRLIEMLASGVIRVLEVESQYSPMNGVGTEGEVAYLVHPCQRHQYAHWNNHLPPDERGAATASDQVPRPWWSSGAGERAGLRE